MPYFLQHAAGDVPVDDNWLSSAEQDRLAAMKIAKRYADWRLGRWTAKRAVALFLGRSLQGSSLAEIEVRPLPSGAPEAFVAGLPAPVSISLSHRDGRAVCAIAKPGTAFGCDLEVVEPRSAAFLADYFTESEQRLMAAVQPLHRWLMAALMWSAKESALKALGIGLRLGLRALTVDLHAKGASCRDVNPEGPPVAMRPDSYSPNHWEPLLVRTTQGQTFRGWCTCQDYWVMTVASLSPGVIGTAQLAGSSRGGFLTHPGECTSTGSRKSAGPGGCC